MISSSANLYTFKANPTVGLVEMGERSLDLYLWTRLVTASHTGETKQLRNGKIAKQGLEYTDYETENK
uniref:Uncharacterized protein n=1 Tax=Megaselia scalaris TaxID=36166 RepID=T1GA67_MEGSC